MLAIIGVVCVIAYTIGCYYPICENVPSWHRVAYIFCHASIWHLIGNIWAMFLISKSNFKVTPVMVVVAFVIAASVPETRQVTVGASGFIYALMGMMSWQALSKFKFHTLTIAFMALGLLWPHRINNMLHIWCYMYGVMLMPLLTDDGRNKGNNRREQAQGC